MINDIASENLLDLVVDVEVLYTFGFAIFAQKSKSKKSKTAKVYMSSSSPYFRLS